VEYLLVLVVAVDMFEEVEGKILRVERFPE
jgi:hypothetical protein